MSSAVLGLIAAAATLVALGLDRPHPWRVSELVAGTPTPQRAVRSDGRTPEVGRHQLRARPPRRRNPTAAGADLVRCIDLVTLAISSGRSVHDAVRVAGRLGSGESAAAFAAVAGRVDAGQPLLGALDELDRRIGPDAAPLRAALAATLRSGAPAGPLLARLAERERHRARRRAEMRVRRLPVLLLGPLVALVLPSFVLLTVVPVGLTTARAARAVMDQDLPTRGPDPSPSAETQGGTP